MGKSGDGGSNRKKYCTVQYMYFDHLLFLTSTLDERPTYSNYPSSKCDQDEVLDEGTIEVTSTKLETIVRPQKQRKIKETEENAKKSYEEELIDVLKKKKPQEDIDEDKSFLMSLLPKFKKFSDNQKFEAQIEILKIMRRVA
ncbi:uncharacterized protein [Macrobrachium rosenbergii]|uniref:uncharacterized protein n=1 Tax=Macrobrachium rosenbergii TaxID=79674 RepID=UPI0034D53171